MCFAAGLFGTILAFIFSYLTQLRLFHEERCRHRHERVYDRHWILLVVAFGSGSFRYRMLERLFSLHLVRVSIEDRRASLIGRSRGYPLSVVFTVWLSIIPALGSRLRPWASRTSPRSLSCIWSHAPKNRQLRK